MIDFVGTPKFMRIALFGCQLNHAFSHSPNMLMIRTTFSPHSGDPIKQFGMN